MQILSETSACGSVTYLCKEREARLHRDARLTAISNYSVRTVLEGFYTVGSKPVYDFCVCGRSVSIQKCIRRPKWYPNIPIFYTCPVEDGTFRGAVRELPRKKYNQQRTRGQPLPSLCIITYVLLGHVVFCSCGSFPLTCSVKRLWSPSF